MHWDMRINGNTAGIIRGYDVVSDGIVVELFQQPFNFLLCGISSNLLYLVNGFLQILYLRLENALEWRGERCLKQIS